MVTGLVVNEKSNIERHRRKVLRAIFHQADLEPQKFINRVEELTGYIGFLTMIRPGDTALDQYRKTVEKVRATLEETAE